LVRPLCSQMSRCPSTMMKSCGPLVVAAWPRRGAAANRPAPSSDLLCEKKSLRLSPALILKIKFQPELHLALRFGRSGLGEVSFSKRVADVRELRFVEDVERLHAKFEASPLGDRKLLLQAEIDIVDPRIAQCAVTGVSKGIRCLPHESGGIEP